MGHSVGDWSAHRVHIDLVVDHLNTLATHAVGHGEALLGLNDSLGVNFQVLVGCLNGGCANFSWFNHIGSTAVVIGGVYINPVGNSRSLGGSVGEASSQDDGKEGNYDNFPHDGAPLQSASHQGRQLVAVVTSEVGFPAPSFFRATLIAG